LAKFFASLKETPENSTKIPSAKPGKLIAEGENMKLFSDFFCFYTTAESQK
jgi:hypothetical protein